MNFFAIFPQKEAFLRTDERQSPERGEKERRR
jgi:hypothetical protein